MKRAEKETFVSELTDNLKGSQAFALMSFNKLTVEQMTNFRLSLRKKGVRVKVVKNTLARRAFDTLPAYKELGTHLEGPVLVAWGGDDPVSATKAIWEWVKVENFDVQVKGGAALGQSMTTDQLAALSRLPGRKELLTSFLWALKSAPTKFLFAVNDIPRRLGYALSALQQKKSQEGGAEAK